MVLVVVGGHVVVAAVVVVHRVAGVLVEATQLRKREAGEEVGG